MSEQRTDLIDVVGTVFTKHLSGIADSTEVHMNEAAQSSLETAAEGEMKLAREGLNVAQRLAQRLTSVRNLSLGITADLRRWREEFRQLDLDVPDISEIADLVPKELTTSSPIGKDPAIQPLSVRLYTRRGRAFLSTLMDELIGEEHSKTVALLTVMGYPEFFDLSPELYARRLTGMLPFDGPRTILKKLRRLEINTVSDILRTKLETIVETDNLGPTGFLPLAVALANEGVYPKGIKVGPLPVHEKKATWKRDSRWNQAST